MAEVLFKDGDTEIRIEQTHSIVSQNLLFFHTKEFITRIKDKSPVFFNLYRENKPFVSIAFEIVDGVAVSLPQSPFGGFIINESFEKNLIKIFLIIIIKHFREQLSIQIKLPSDSYSQFHEEIHAILANAGFSTLCLDINQHISVDQQTFIDKINRNRRRKLESNISQGFIFKKLDTSYLNKAYELIKECRIDKGYPVTMTLEALQNSFSVFPERYFLFGVFDKNEMIATAISIRVSNKILYNFYHGDRLSHRKNGPVTLLVAGIYEYCQQQGFEILDLGISTDKGVLNEGLFYFKESCGATSTDKVSYSMNFQS